MKSMKQSFTGDSADLLPSDVCQMMYVSEFSMGYHRLMVEEQMTKDNVVTLELSGPSSSGVGISLELWSFRFYAQSILTYMNSDKLAELRTAVAVFKEMLRLRKRLQGEKESKESAAFLCLSSTGDLGELIKKGEVNPIDSALSSLFNEYDTSSKGCIDVHQLKAMLNAVLCERNIQKFTTLQAERIMTCFVRDASRKIKNGAAAAAIKIEKKTFIDWIKKGLARTKETTETYAKKGVLAKKLNYFSSGVKVLITETTKSTKSLSIRTHEHIIKTKTILNSICRERANEILKRLFKVFRGALQYKRKRSSFIIKRFFKHVMLLVKPKQWRAARILQRFMSIRFLLKRKIRKLKHIFLQEKRDQIMNCLVSSQQASLPIGTHVIVTNCYSIGGPQQYGVVVEHNDGASKASIQM